MKFIALMLVIWGCTNLAFYLTRNTYPVRWFTEKLVLLINKSLPVDVRCIKCGQAPGKHTQRCELSKFNG